MKRFIICFVSILLAVGAYAQSYTETVYLKNGGVIKGVIIEQTPGDNIKIRTRDGNIFVYYYDEISKITKDISKFNGNSDYSGYKGFVDLGYSLGFGDYSDYNGRLELTVSNGYQFNSYLYLGAGAGVNYYCQNDADTWSFPLFFNPRLTIPTPGSVSAFIDAKVGYTVGQDIEGFYLAPSLGTRIALTNRNAINLSVGYTLQKANFDYYSYSGSLSFHAITFKLGFEF